VIHTEDSGFASPALGSAHFHVSWLSDFIFYHKPLYKSLHQSFFYSFKTIALTLNGYSNFINAVKRQRNLGLPQTQRFLLVLLLPMKFIPHWSQWAWVLSNLYYITIRGTIILLVQGKWNMTCAIASTISRRQRICLTSSRIGTFPRFVAIGFYFLS
jgi:hypothetical protein